MFKPGEVLESGEKHFSWIIIGECTTFLVDTQKTIEDDYSFTFLNIYDGVFFLYEGD